MPIPNATPHSPKLVARISLGVAVLALLWAIFAWRVQPPNQDGLTIFVKDQVGKPRIEVTLVGPDGVSLSPDGRGLVKAAASWSGKIISVRDRATWRELAKIRLGQPADEIFEITLP